MICQKCVGSGIERDESGGWKSVRICPDCGGCGIAHCCEGECVDQAEKEKPHAAEEAK